MADEDHAVPDEARLSYQIRLEQYQAELRDFAPLVGTYYEALKEAGIPEELATILVTEWHGLQWATWLGS